jgi:hypothetical protein
VHNITDLTFIRAVPRLHVVDSTGYNEIYLSLLIWGVVQGHFGVPSSKDADRITTSIPLCKANQSSVSSLQVAVHLHLESAPIVNVNTVVRFYMALRHYVEAFSAVVFARDKLQTGYR